MISILTNTGPAPELSGVKTHPHAVSDETSEAIVPYRGPADRPDYYWNGAGFCSGCGLFKSQAFTAEDLGAYCRVCGIPTLWSHRRDPEAPEPDGMPLFTCEEHTEKSESRVNEWLDDMVDKVGNALRAEMDEDQ